MDKLWDYLDEKNISLFNSAVPFVLTCNICRDILKDPVYGCCGCRFCRKCITTLDKRCPKCDTDVGELNDDLPTNIDLAKVKVQCPNFKCDEYVEQINLLDHLRVCSKSKVRCIVNDIGSNCDDVGTDEYEEHFRVKNAVHVNVLVQMLKEMHNSFENVKKTNIAAMQDIMDRENEIMLKLQDLEKGVSKIFLVTEFEWIVNQVDSLKDDAPIFSNPFYLMGYKMCIVFGPWANRYDIGLILLPDAKNEELEWPIPYIIKLQILNQKTGEVYQEKQCSWITSSVGKDDYFQPLVRQRLNDSFFGIRKTSPTDVIWVHSVLIKCKMIDTSQKSHGDDRSENCSA